MTNRNLYHLKLDESNPRKRRMLCGVGDSMTLWNTLKYLKWHISKDRWCLECMEQSEYICEVCNHWGDNHEGGKCLNKNCPCTRKFSKIPLNLQF